jgi:hypothetical protein
LTTRPPVPAHEGQAEARRTQALQLAAGVGSLDPVAGRALLTCYSDPGLADWEKQDGHLPQGLLALALVDPATAGRHFQENVSPYTAAAVLNVLRRRPVVLRQFDLLHRMWWLRGSDFRWEVD